MTPFSEAMQQKLAAAEAAAMAQDVRPERELDARAQLEGRRLATLDMAIRTEGPHRSADQVLKTARASDEFASGERKAPPPSPPPSIPMFKFAEAAAYIHAHRRPDLDLTIELQPSGFVVRATRSGFLQYIEYVGMAEFGERFGNPLLEALGKALSRVS